MAGNDCGLENLEKIEGGGITVSERRVVAAVVCECGVEV